MSKTGQGAALMQDIRHAVDHERVGRGRERGHGDGIAEHVVRPGHGRGGRDRQSVRHQAKVAIFARAKHQAMRPEAYRLTEAIDRFVMDFKLGHHSPNRQVCGVRPIRRSTSTSSVDD